MRVSPSVTSLEHWLTLMTCAICSHTPDKSPVYECKLGHTICDPCFHKLVNSGDRLCNVCRTDKFWRHDVSEDFLKKLKVKPGIGRPCRYDLNGPKKIEVSESVTVEQLFQMSSEKLQKILSQGNGSKPKLISVQKKDATESLMSKSCEDIENSSSQEYIKLQ